MTKRIGNKRTPAMKKRAAFMMKQIFRTPKQLAKDAAEACRRRIQYLHEKKKKKKDLIPFKILPLLTEERLFLRIMTLVWEIILHISALVKLGRGIPSNN